MTATMLRLTGAARRKRGADTAGNGPGHTCALCHAPFWIEANRVTAYRGRDRRLYCSREHAEFGIEKVQQVLATLPARVA